MQTGMVEHFGTGGHRFQTGSVLPAMDWPGTCSARGWIIFHHPPTMAARQAASDPIVARSQQFGVAAAAPESGVKPSGAAARGGKCHNARVE
jgi:hypothetical protein